MLTIVTAHHAEAKPFIDYYGMGLVVLADGQKIFREAPLNAGTAGTAGRIQLLVTGQGQQNCFTSLSRMIAQIENTGSEIWMNFGVAGSSQFSVGSLVQGVKVNGAIPDGVSMIHLLGLDDTEIHSGKSVESTYLQNGVYEMEAMALMQVLQEARTKPAVSLIKLVSDGPTQPVAVLTKSSLCKLIDSRATAITRLSDKLLQLL